MIRMEEIMIDNAFLKIKILELEREYLQKRGIKNPDSKTKINMRKAVSSKLSKEIRSLRAKHDNIVNKIW